jgi:hypothetical protein
MGIPPTPFIGFGVASDVALCFAAAVAFIAKTDVGELHVVTV